MILVLMGVSGVGKSTVGRLLASELGWEFHDADDLHPLANIEKMRRGVPLTDADRGPWLAAVAALLRRISGQGRDAVIACSALKSAYREAIASGNANLKFVFLDAPAETIARRLALRHGHFMPPELLASQIRTLEPPEGSVRVDASQQPKAIMREVRRALGM